MMEFGFIWYTTEFRGGASERGKFLVQAQKKDSDVQS
jgi:hypothetical protein